VLYLKFVNTKNNKTQRSKEISCGVTIGRDLISDIRLLDDTTLSRLHAFVFPASDDRLELRDLSSTAGTYVSEKNERRRILPEQGEDGPDKGRALLSVGDMFFMGVYQVEVCSENVIGESSWNRRFHESLKEAEKEITEVDYFDL